MAQVYVERGSAALGPHSWIITSYNNTLRGNHTVFHGNTANVAIISSWGFAANSLRGLDSALSSRDTRKSMGLRVGVQSGKNYPGREGGG
jgi:hypothetical protein